jgi:hypothetical protein
MQKPVLTAVVFAATFLAAGARAQTNGAPVATPSSPAPAVAAPAPAAPATAAPNQIIYAPRLPSAAELTNAAAAQGVSVERIDQTASQISVTYKYSSGEVKTVAYQLLPTGTMPAPTQTTVVQTAPAPAVVYAPPPRVIYYEEPVYYPRYYYPYYPPVSLSFGFGYRHFGGHYGGGFHHHR